MLSLDARSQAEYGTLRSFIRVGVQQSTPNDATSGAVFWDRSFIQYAGFTVGKTQSFFDILTILNKYSYVAPVTTGDTDGTGVAVWAYTAQFGNGFSATLSAESPADHNKAGTFDLTVAGGWGAGTLTRDNAFSVNGGNGFRVPDVIGNFRVEQAWGFLQVSGALHDASGAYYATPNNVANGHPADKLGYAVAVGGVLNIPGGFGDTFGFQATYARGATGFVTNIEVAQKYDASSSVGLFWASDAVFGTGTVVELTEAWGFNAAYDHRWNQRWKTSLYGGYVEVNYNGNATAWICANRAVFITPLAGAQPAGFNCDPSFSFYQVGSRTQFNPHPLLDIGLDVVYTKLNAAFKGPANVAANPPRPAVGQIDDQSIWSAILRWQRNFYP